MVDRYLDPDILYPDAKTAVVLSIGGHIRYKVLKSSGVNDCQLVENVLSETYKLHQDKKIVVTLSRALLWTCFDAEGQDIIPLQIMKRVQTAYETIQKLENTLNPVCKVPLVVCGHEGQLIIEEFFDDDAPMAETPAHYANNFPVTPEVLNRRRSRYLSEMQVVFTQLMLI